MGSVAKQTSQHSDRDSIRWGRDQWEAKYGREHATAMEASSALLRTREVVTGFMDDRLAKVDLSWVDYDLLSVIEFIGGGAMALGKIRHFVRRFIIHQTSVTNVVARMADRGIVEMKPDDKDRRVTLVGLTPLGRRRLRRAHTLLAEEDFGLAGLTPAQQRTLTDLLYAIRLNHNDVHPMPAHE